MSGCSLLGDPIAGKVADVIDDYCSEPLQARELYRDTVNEQLAAEGHSIEVHCAGDPDTTSAIGGPLSGNLVAAVDAWCSAADRTFVPDRHRSASHCQGKQGEGG